MRNRSPKVRFHNTPLHKRREPHALKFLMERSSFWIASLSLIAFLTGNMVGQHGWHVFWASVWGEGSDAYIAYVGVTSPIDKVPDYNQWARFGGDPHEHTFRQVPRNVLVDLPKYNASSQANHQAVSSIGQIYSVGYMGAYSTGGDRDGSHPGIDIRVPVGTPVVAMANGVIDEVKSGGGFGKVVVIRHPNIPDPRNPKQTTTLYSIYAHLQTMYVEKGAVVQKGERIALSGQSGFASGPHLHFQIDREEAPWHPYWPFTGTEARRAGMNISQAVNSAFHAERGYEYTANPMLYVQSNYTAAPVIARSDQLKNSAAKRRALRSRTAVVRAPRVIRRTTVASRISRLKSRTSQRIRARLTRRRFATASRDSVPYAAAPDSPLVISRVTTVSASAEPTVPSGSTVSRRPIASIGFRHDGKFAGRGWETIEITLLDSDGHRASADVLRSEIFLRTAYGEAEFRPSVLRERNFINGVATVKMLPRGKRTVVIKAYPFADISKPMVYKK